MNLVMRFPPLHAYARLMRLDKPVGIWLLMWPCWWSVTLAAGSLQPGMLALFFLGAVVMRSAGCIVNDIVDRDIDAQVARTRNRPIASGEVSVAEGWALVAALLTLALVIALMLGWQVVALGVAWLPLVALYPWMKRLIAWPQLFLGLTFNAGALFGWMAVRGGLDAAPVLLYLAGVCWTLGYDTIYAYQDRRDDLRLGVRSTALWCGAHSKRWIGLFYAACLAFLLAAGIWHALSAAYYAGLLAVALHLLWQIRRVKAEDTESCRRMFRANQWTGLLIFLSILAGAANY